MTVFYMQLTGTGITGGDLNTLASNISTQWGVNVKSLASAAVTLTAVDVVYIPSVGNELVGSWTGSVAGTLSGTDVENASTAVVVNWLISAYYRGGHPRWYFPGIVQGSITNGSAVAGSYLTSAAADFAALRTALNGLTTTNISAAAMGTLSFQTGNAWRTTPIFRPFTGVKIRTVIGTQRRRLKS